MMQKKHVLLVTYGGGHCMMMIPLWRYLKQNSMCEVSILGLTTAGPALSAQGIPYLSYKDFIRPGDEQVLLWGEELASSAHSEHSGIPLEETMAYLGFSFADLVAEHGLHAAQQIYREKGRFAFNPQQFLTRVIDKLKPDLVVTTNCPRSERAALAIAEAQQIPNIALVDLFGKMSTYPLKAQHICVLGQEVIGNLKASGCVAEQYHITGNSAMDAAFDHKGPTDYVWRRQHFPNLRDDSKTLLFDAQYPTQASTGRAHKSSAQAILIELNQLAKICADKQVALFIRPHPNQAPEIFKKWVATQKICDAFWAGSEVCDLYPLLNASDVVVSQTSTIMLEALYMQRSVIQLDCPDSFYNYRYDQAGFAWFAGLEDTEKFAACLKEALTDTQKNAQMKQRFSEQFNHEPATPKIGELIRDLLVTERKSSP